MRARARRVPEDLERDAELDALGALLREGMRQVLSLMPNLPRETAGILDNVRESGALADLIASNLSPEQASVAGQAEDPRDVRRRRRACGAVLAIVNRQLEMLRVKKEVSSMIADEGKAQREQILRQQMKTIKEELGEAGEEDEVEELRERLRVAQASPTRCRRSRASSSGASRGMQQQSAEYNVTRTYLEWLADLPWSKTTPDKLDVEETRRCLDEDHYGLEKIKKRIIEYIAVRKLRRRARRRPILCFIGPPGVGKTSLGRSIARSMGRRYHRIALGGVRDEAEIRGHRRTYVGALPGRIMQGMKKVGVKNPVIVLDEVDKMGVDMLGDPAAALLEVLDPAQNSTFQDHYIDVAVRPLAGHVPLHREQPGHDPAAPLWDRIEVIECAGLHARREAQHREGVPRPQAARARTASPTSASSSSEDGLERIIDSYTREAGVRGLEREIGSVCRRVAMRIAEGETDLVHEGRRRRRREDPRPAALHAGPRRAHELARRRDGPRVDAVGRRHPLHRGDAMPGKGEHARHRQPEERDERERGAPRCRSCAATPKDLGLDPEFLKIDRPPPARAQGRHAEGRAERGRDDVHARSRRSSSSAR